MVLTVKKLKEILKEWPDETESGEPAEVWIETGLMLSSPVVNYSRLGRWDILLNSNAFEDNNK